MPAATRTGPGSRPEPTRREPPPAPRGRTLGRRRAVAVRNFAAGGERVVEAEPPRKAHKRSSTGTSGRRTRPEVRAGPEAGSGAGAPCSSHGRRGVREHRCIGRDPAELTRRWGLAAKLAANRNGRTTHFRRTSVTWGEEQLPARVHVHGRLARLRVAGSARRLTQSACVVKVCFPAIYERVGGRSTTELGGRICA